MRLVIVSNRLPVTVVDTGSGFIFHDSVGGLVTSLSSFLAHLPDEASGVTEYLWVGWPGISVASERQGELQAAMLAQLNAWPVFVDEAVMDEFYHGFCNKTLWPLFHYFPGYTAYDEASWEVYQSVNAQFCAVVGALAGPGDAIWIHDYHFLLLPKLLRAQLPEASIGFFLHIPFPTYEVYRLMPSAWRTELLDGLLGADLIGVHTPDDADYLRTCVARLLGGAVSGETVRAASGRAAVVRAFPISIDVERYAEAPSLPAVQAEVGELQERLADQKAIISIDRLDYSKGIYQRLLGYQTFLAEHPQWHGRVTFILVVVPSRIGVDQYQRLRQQIDETVGHVNGQYGSVHWTPIIYQYRSLPFASLIALYALGDVALITPLRDGMNLVAKEYVAARAEQDGVLILSEMAGAAHELTSALLINPNNRREIAGAIAAALSMPAAAQAARMTAMQSHLRAHSVQKWAIDFLSALGQAGEPPRE